MTQEEKIEHLAKAVMTLSELGDGKTAYVLNEIRLEMKSQLELPEGLEEAAGDAINDYCPEGVSTTEGLVFTKSAMIGMFKDGAEWKYQKDRGEFAKLKAKEWSDGYNKGIVRGKEKMMEDAVEIEVKEDAGGYPIVPLDAIELYNYEKDKPLAKTGDKVKVIVIKED